MRTIVLPAFEHLLLREITVSRVDRFLRHLAANRSYAMAKHARTVLSLALGLAVRYDALPRNPVRETKRLRKPPTKVKALSVADVAAVREAIRAWRRDDGLPGPKPDGQLEQIVEVMLGSSARIGEVLALRKCDVDVTCRPARLRICGTIVSPKGVATYRQAHPKTSSSVKRTRCWQRLLLDAVGADQDSPCAPQRLPDKLPGGAGESSRTVGERPTRSSVGASFRRRRCQQEAKWNFKISASTQSEA